MATAALSGGRFPSPPPCDVRARAQPPNSFIRTRPRPRARLLMRPGSKAEQQRLDSSPGPQPPHPVRGAPASPPSRQQLAGGGPKGVRLEPVATARAEAKHSMPMGPHIRLRVASSELHLVVYTHPPLALVGLVCMFSVAPRTGRVGPIPTMCKRGRRLRGAHVPA